ncbi:MAG: hypothetical protein JWL81_1386, partial [Verrucomicrobiales bacterium]|nr:hypothetical protein [Verrucomicrobiales bacterium]
MATRSLPVTAIPLLLLAGAAVVFFLSPSEPAPSLSGKNGPPLTTTNPPSTNDAASGQDADNSLTANGSSSSSNPSTPSWVPMDLQNAEAIDRLPGWEVRRGNFKLIRDPANRHASLELFPEPIVEGKIRCARMMW